MLNNKKATFQQTATKAKAIAARVAAVRKNKETTEAKAQRLAVVTTQVKKDLKASPGILRKTSSAGKVRVYILDNYKSFEDADAAKDEIVNWASKLFNTKGAAYCCVRTNIKRVFNKL